ATIPPASMSRCARTSLTALVNISHASIVNLSTLSYEHASLDENNPSSGTRAFAGVRALRSRPPRRVCSGADCEPTVGLFARPRQLSARRLPALRPDLNPGADARHFQP